MTERFRDESDIHDNDNFPDKSSNCQRNRWKRIRHPSVVPVVNRNYHRVERDNDELALSTRRYVVRKCTAFDKQVKKKEKKLRNLQIPLISSKTREAKDASRERLSFTSRLFPIVL